MPHGKRKRPPQRLSEQEQEARAWNADDVRPAVPPAVEDQLAEIVESYAQEEEAQVEQEIIMQKARAKKRPVASIPKRFTGTPVIHLCSFTDLERIDDKRPLDPVRTLRLHIAKDAPEAFLITEGPEDVIVARAPAQTCRAVASLVNIGFVSLLPLVQEDPERLTVRVLLSEEALEQEASFDDASERGANIQLRLLFEVAMAVRGDNSFELFSPRSQRQPRKTLSGPMVQRLFAATAPPADAPVLPALPNGLLLALRRYQLQAVQWMCSREESITSLPNPLWEKLSDASAPGHSFLYNRSLGRVKRLQEVPQLQDTAGGILADEMGLGKTLEVISLLLARPSAVPRPTAPKFTSVVSCICGAIDEDDQAMVQCDDCLKWQHCDCVEFEPSANFYCRDCISFVSQPPVPARGTLIICPASILEQWRDEIRMHTAPGSLQVYVYKSVRDQGKLVHPRKLLHADVVLTTYETLRADLAHVQDGNRGREFRSKRRYPPLPTPLTHIDWHRIVLDECQLVEGHTAAAEMARQLTATYRWAVSGTPIGTSLDDLFGLFTFLHVLPYGERVWWLRALAVPFEGGNEAPLLSVLKRLMWRNTKAAVADQIGIPAQHEHVSTLRLKEVEAYWYKKQNDDACFKANEMLALEAKRGQLTLKQRANLLLPLLQLRQACCHPQVGAHGIRSLRKNPMTMGELLDALIEKAKVEAVDAQRGLLAAINGLAALALCQKDADKAVEIYRECMMVMSANEDDLPSDKLQRMHCLHNMAYALDQQARARGTSESGGVALQLRRMGEEEEGLRQEYVRDRLNRVVAQQAKTSTLTEEASAALDRFNLEWMLIALRAAQKASPREEFDVLLFSLVRDTLEHGGRSGVIGKRRLASFRDLNGLQLVLVKEVDELLQARRDFMGALATLSNTLTPAELAEASNCSRCRRKKGPLCRHCAALPLMEAYQQRLYTVLRQAEENGKDVAALGEDDAQRRRPELLIQRTPSEAETVLKLVYGFAGHHLKDAVGEKALAEGEQCLQTLQLLKKELDAAQALWRHRVDYVAALDEVDMCLMRISVVPDNERVAENERHYRIHMDEVPAMTIKLNADKLRAANELSHAQRQLSYLRQLSPQTTATAECPVCHEQVGQRRVLFPCGHVFCSDCVVSLMRHSHSLTTVKCPSCREIINKEEVSYVQDDAPPQPEALPNVRGSYGTKIEHIVGTLLNLSRADPLAKSIVFSEWADVLRIVANALEENNIPYLEIKQKKNFDKTIGTFKHSPAIRVLLMTTKQGANGLNLIEATNVLLVEPLLNPAVENQAINRVHRIGQTHETRVFRFIISNTVEERIFAYNRKRSASASVEVNLKRKSTEAEIGLDNVAELLGLGSKVDA